MRRSTTVAIVVGALAGGAAWTTGDGPIQTEPAPVDVMLEAAAEAGSPPEAASARPASRPASMALRPRATWDLPQTYNTRVQYWIDYLAGANRHRTQLWLEREGRYGPMIRERLAERGMPQDLVYLAMIESGLSAKAYSHAHASGMWQFIAETGKRYGLEVSPFVDERRDPVEATDAALDYLSELYDRFGSWYLAAAAYNSGENRVERILRQQVDGQKGKDGLFWMIDEYLPRETRDYVPLMLAAAHIGKDPAKYGFHEIPLEAPLSYEEVTVPGGVSLSAVANAAGVETKAVSELNPHLLREVTPPGAERVIRIPVGGSVGVEEAMERLSAESRVATVMHRVARGETLGHIARRYGVSVAELRRLNGIGTRIYPGQRLRVPA